MLLVSGLHKPDPILSLCDPSSRNKVTTEAAPVKHSMEWLEDTSRTGLPLFPTRPDI